MIIYLSVNLSEISDSALYLASRSIMAAQAGTAGMTTGNQKAGPSRLPFDPDSPLFVAQMTLVSGKSYPFQRSFAD